MIFFLETVAVIYEIRRNIYVSSVIWNGAAVDRVCRLHSAKKMQHPSRSR